MPTKEWLMWGFHTLATDGRKMFVAIQTFPSTFISSPFLLERLFLSRSRKKTSQEIKKKKNLLEYSRESCSELNRNYDRYLCLTKTWDYNLKVKQWRDKVKAYTSSNSAVYLWFVESSRSFREDENNPLATLCLHGVDTEFLNEWEK